MQWPARLLLSLVLVLGCLAPLQRTSAAQDAVATPDLSTIALSPNDCAFLIQGSDDPRARLGSIACGTLDVPEDWSQPDGRRLQIGYLVLKSTAAQPSPDPVIFLAGGPGSSPLTSAEVWSRFFAGLRQERDVIFFDQRGTRLSSPLRCEAYTKLMALVLPPDEDDSAGPPVTPEYPANITNPDDLLQTARERYGPAAVACAQQLKAQGVDLTQYTSIASANDAVALVKALGYDEYNLYGISYGTRLALEVMRNHADSGLRSVVLDSTYPPEVKTYELLSVSTHEVAMQLFADCQQNPTCEAAYPDLKQRFVALLARLRDAPVIAADGTPITDRDVINVMHSLTSRVEIVPYVPLLIDELERGEDDTYRGIASGSLFATANSPAEASVALPDMSAARRFVLDLGTNLASGSGQEKDASPQAFVELDALSHDQQTLREFIDRALSQPEQAETRTTLITAIDAMSDAEVQEIFAVIEQTITLEDSKIAGQSVAQYYSIECNERMPFQSFAKSVENAQQLEIPELALGKPEDLAKVFAICEQWPSGRAPDVEAEPVTSDIPTLILSGAYDNLTPVSWNTSASKTLSHGTLVLVPMSGHAAITYSACAEDVGQAFVADPSVVPDTSCLADLAPRWVMPNDAEAQAPTPADVSEVATTAESALLPRAVLLPVEAVQEAIPEIAVEIDTGPNATVMGAPVANRAVTYATADGMHRVVLSVDQYATASDAKRAFDDAAAASEGVPGVTTEAVSGLGEAALIGVVTQGDETHVGGGALFGALIVNATLQTFDGTDENKARVAELIQAQAEYAEKSLGVPPAATPAS